MYDVSQNMTVETVGALKSFNVLSKSEQNSSIIKMLEFGFRQMNVVDYFKDDLRIVS